MATCPTCAHLTAEGQRFCPSCGTPLDLDGMPTGTAPRSLSPPAAARLSTSKSGLRRAPTPTPGTPAPRFVSGELFAERYRVVGLLGRGGMGEVYRADDLRLGQAVALKFLPESLRDDEGRRERFYNEVRTAREVAHPAVCRVYDIAEAGGQPFLTMEYVDGEDLASLLRRIGRLPADKALDIARQLCAGLAAAHDKGVLHRDLKPDNGMLDGRGKVRITDFGLAGLAEAIPREDIRSGTPAYMSPEQLAGREVTGASDIYALGLVLYELFTGKKPFEGKTPAEIMRRHEEATPASPSTLVGEIDPAVERVILRCLEKDARLRPSSALAVAAAGAETLPPRAAHLLLAIGLVALVLVPHMARPIQLTGRVALDKPPEALEDRARDVLRALGSPGPATDYAMGFRVDEDYLSYLQSRSVGEDRWAPLAAARPAALHFWYRQSPRPIVSTMMIGRIRWSSPVADVTDMAGIELDMEGRLLSFQAVTPQLESDARVGPAPDWAPLFVEARLDPTQYARADPRWTPPFYVDARSAWVRADPSRTDLPARIEAAAYRGRPVYFQLVDTWTRPDRMIPFPFGSGQRAAVRVAVVFLLALTFGALRLARDNLRLGRGDRRGASRIASLTLVLLLVSWLTTAHHVADMLDELALALRGISLILAEASSLWILYVALEPYVRRQWPETLVSWTRVLAGRFRDPAVGRDLLVGAAIGCAFTVIYAMAWSSLVPLAGGAPPHPLSDDDALLGTRFALASLIFSVVAAIANGFGLALLRVGLSRLLRYEVAVAAVFTLIASLQDALFLGGRLWLMLPLVMVISGLPLYVIVRFGVLPSMVGLFITHVLLSFPAPVSLGHWSAVTGLMAMALAGVVLIYGYMTSQAGGSRAPF